MKTLDQVTIICASKYFSPIEMLTLKQKGVSHFGENRVDAFLEKYEKLSKDMITWHFIGHLQRNKAKQVISKLDFLHTLDSLELAQMIQSLREKPLNCFIQVNATNEAQKYGISLEEVPTFMSNIKKYDKINVVGFMSMGKQDDAVETKRAFDIVEQLRHEYNLLFTSMGMSDDYLIALQSNTTHLRLGRYFKQFLEG
jgi:pyridoxal phosphate enzyme (YggS family)